VKSANITGPKAKVHQRTDVAMPESHFKFTEREAKEGRDEQREQVRERFTEHRTLDQIHAGLWQEYEWAMDEHPPNIDYADDMLHAMQEAERDQA